MCSHLYLCVTLVLFTVLCRAQQSERYQAPSKSKPPSKYNYYTNAWFNHFILEKVDENTSSDTFTQKTQGFLVTTQTMGMQQLTTFAIDLMFNEYSRWNAAIYCKTAINKSRSKSFYQSIFFLTFAAITFIMFERNYKSTIYRNIIIILNYYIWLNSASSNYSTWNLGSTVMPYGLDTFPVAYDDYHQKILLVGGYPGSARDSVLSFDTNTLNFSNETTLPQSVYMHGQQYTKLNNILYWVSGVGSPNSIDKMLVHSCLIEWNFMEIAHPSQRCLTSFSSYHDYLIFTGGTDTDITNILDITDSIWLSNIDNLNIARSKHGCAVVDQRVYVFGGKTDIGFGGTIEILDVSDMTSSYWIQQSSWTNMNDKLVLSASMTYGVVFGTDIVVHQGSTTLSIINTITQTVLVSPGGPLNYSIAYTFPIAVYPNIYIFGGQVGIGLNIDYKDTWQYHSSKLPVIHNYDLPINIYPSLYSPVNRTINIRSTIDAGTHNNISYYVKFNVLYQYCPNPTLTIYFQDTDFNGLRKHFHVYYEDNLIANCGSNNDVCNDYKYCLQNYNMPNTIENDAQFIIRIEKGRNSGIPNGCYYSLWADVTLQCDAATMSPSSEPTTNPTINPTNIPTTNPSTYPSTLPSNNPSWNPSNNPTNYPTTLTTNPTIMPTANPTNMPTANPTTNPSTYPSNIPTNNPTNIPTVKPTYTPTVNPTTNPTLYPSNNPTLYPSNNPTLYPSNNPSLNPTHIPTMNPTMNPTINPTNTPTINTIINHDQTIEPTMNQDSANRGGRLHISKEFVSICFTLFLSFF